MGKLASFTISGMDLWFWSMDHNPPHFHAKRKGKWEVRVQFLEELEDNVFEIVWEETTFSKKDKRDLLAMVKAHRAKIFQEWESKVNSDGN